MKLRRFLLLSSLLFSVGALAEDAAPPDGAALAGKNGCMSCHDMVKKLAGPSFREIAARYKGDKEAAARLVKKVRGGGVGTFGPTPMPANSPQVSDEDIRSIVAWILSLS